MRQLANGNVNVERTVLPDGVPGVDMTVARMNEIAFGEYGSRSAKIRALAINIVRKAGIAEKDYYGEIRAIHNWVRDKIRYTKDPINQETLSHPEEMAFNTLAGDCLDEDTLLLTPTGLVRIADIKIGDTIYGKNGWTTVTNFWDKGFLSTNAVMLDNGSEFFATDDHRCFLADGSESTVSDLPEGAALMQPGSIQAAGGNGLSTDDLRFIGLYAADGWTDGNRVCIAGKDGHPKEEQKRWVQQYAEGKGWQISWHPRYIRVYSKGEAESIVCPGTATDKALDWKLILSCNESQAKALLRGLLADSHQPQNRRSGLCFSSASQELALQVRVLYRMLGVGCRITRVDEHGGLGDNPIYRVYPRLYRCKAAKLESREDIGVCHVYDIETEDHGIYLPEADVTVHNCDDKTVLEMALLGAMGIKSWPVVIGQRPNHYSHVYLRAMVPAGAKRHAGKVISLDPIMKKWKAGREAPAEKVKAIKEYPQEAEQEMQDIGNIWDNPMFSDGVTDPGMAGYVDTDSYLDDDQAWHSVQNLLKMNSQPDVTPEMTIANGTQVTQELEGLDGFLMGAEADEAYLDPQVAAQRNDRGVITAPMGSGLGPSARDKYLGNKGPNDPKFMSLFNKGPLTAAGAADKPLQAVGARPAPALGTKKLPTTTQGDAKKTYHVNEAVAASRSKRGKGALHSDLRKGGKTVLVITDDDQRWECTPLTAEEESDEIEGLAMMLADMTVLAGGLGSDAMEPEAQVDTAQKLAAMGWWARFKARMLNWRAKMAERGSKREAQKLKQAKAKAVKVAKQIEQVEKQVAKKSPALAQKMADAKRKLETAEATEATGTQIEQNTVKESLTATKPKRNRSLFARRIALSQTRPVRTEKQVDMLRRKLNEMTAKEHMTMKAKLKKAKKIEAKIPVLALQEPGKRNMKREVITDQSVELDPAAPASMEGLPTIPMPGFAPGVLSKPAVQYSILALGGFLLYKKMKG